MYMENWVVYIYKHWSVRLEYGGGVFRTTVYTVIFEHPLFPDPISGYYFV